MKFYYKVIQSHVPVGKIIDTNYCINEYRVLRNNELKSFFEKAENFSNEFELSISLVLNDTLLKLMKLHKTFIIKGIKYIVKMKKLAKEREKCNFILNDESNFFIDYILEKKRKNLEIEENVILPSRFNSSFFFESADDCNKYYPKFNCNGEIQIVKVEFIETRKSFTFDNSIISDFSRCITSIDYLNHAKLYLSGYISDNPLLEVVFQGKYKIISYIN
ncbi:MAG: hypothetical protein Q7U47_00210 [Paludibacter sp.]|nr:hypothetical protein [Paludibacter sp.]